MKNFTEYEVAGVGIVTAHEGPHYIVKMLDGRVCAFRSNSGTPAEADAAADIATPAPELVAVPISVRSAALRYVLNGAGLRSAVETDIAKSDQNAKDAWEFETTIRRDHPLVSALGDALGLTSAQIDALFISAAQL